MPIYVEDLHIPVQGTEFTEYNADSLLVQNIQGFAFRLHQPLPLKDGQRGLLFSPVAPRESNGEFSVHQHFDPQDLRTAALFWDRIDYPLCGPIGSFDDEAEFLAQENVLQRSWVVDASEGTACDMDSFYEAAAAATIIGLSQQNRMAKWHAGLTEIDVRTISASFPERDGLALVLAPLLPVPSIDVPLDDVLAFKARKTPELKALHQFIDDLSLQVARDPEGPIDSHAAQGKLKKAVEDLNDPLIFRMT